MSTPTGGSWNNDQDQGGQGYQGQSLGQGFGQQSDQGQQYGQEQQPEHGQQYSQEQHSEHGQQYSQEQQPEHGQQYEQQYGQGQHGGAATYEPQQSAYDQGARQQGHEQSGQSSFEHSSFEQSGQYGQGQQSSFEHTSVEHGQQGQPYGQAADSSAHYDQHSGQASGPGFGQQSEHAQQHQGGGFSGHAQQAGQEFVSGAGQVASGAGEGIGQLFSDVQFKRSLTERIASLTFLGVLIWAVLNFITNTVYNFSSEDYGDTSVKHMSTGSALLHLVTDLIWLIVFVAIVRLLLELAINVARIATRNNRS